MLEATGLTDCCAERLWASISVGFVTPNPSPYPIRHVRTLCSLFKVIFLLMPYHTTTTPVACLLTTLSVSSRTRFD